MAPKVDGADDAVLSAGRAAGAVAGVRIVSTCIACTTESIALDAPIAARPFRMKPLRAAVAISTSYAETNRSPEKRWRAAAEGWGKGCRVHPGKISRANRANHSMNFVAMMPALQQVSSIELLLLAA